MNKYHWGITTHFIYFYTVYPFLFKTFVIRDRGRDNEIIIFYFIIICNAVCHIHYNNRCVFEYHSFNMLFQCKQIEFKRHFIGSFSEILFTMCSCYLLLCDLISFSVQKFIFIKVDFGFRIVCWFQLCVCVRLQWNGVSVFIKIKCKKLLNSFNW